MLHGRPTALPGSEYANLFVHWKPRGWTEEARPELGAFARTADRGTRRYMTISRLWSDDEHEPAG